MLNVNKPNLKSFIKIFFIFVLLSLFTCSDDNDPVEFKVMSSGYNFNVKFYIDEGAEHACTASL